MAKYCYLNGQIMLTSQAKVSVYDIGMLRGFGIYEALTTHNKKPFLIDDHLKRFRLSAAALSIKIPNTDEEITKAIIALIQKNNFAETNIKLILTGGATIDGIDYDSDFPTFYILAEEFEPMPKEYLEKGSAVITHTHERQYPQFKTSNYITAVMLQKLRKEKKALEILYISGNNKVLEFSTSNFFMVKNNKLITPKDSVLLGITRKVVLDLAQKNNIEIEEREIDVEELNTADEAFLTASFKEVVPVVKIDEKQVGSGVVGPVTKKVMDLFYTFTKNY